jgi:Mn-dependent DtxR family transcriptional regulator
MAVIFETTPGPAMAVTATLFYLLAALISPGKGIISRIIRKRQLQNRILQEDIMKHVFRLHQKGKLRLEKLLDLIDQAPRKLNRQVNNLITSGMITKHDQYITLTTKGKDEANRLIRAHRLWETYLVDQLGLNEEQIHEEAEKYEHLLTEELLDEVDKTLGYPTQDPHGSPIPSKVGNPEKSLWQCEPGTAMAISSNQPSQSAVSDLWRLGLTPGQEIFLQSREENEMTIRFENRSVSIKKELAVKINVV